MSALALLRRQRGFTLAEMLIVVIIVGLLMAALMPVFVQNVAWMQRAETRSRLDRLRVALELVYRQQAWTIDSQVDAVLATGTQTITPGTLVDAQWADVLRIGGLSPDVLRDGFNRPWQVQISVQLTRNRDGAAIPYHVIAFASNQGGDYDGAAQALDAATVFDTATGAVTFAGGDVGTVVDGYAVWESLAADTDRRVRAVADAYGVWYRARVRQTPAAAPGVDFFASRAADTAWDVSAAAPQILADCDFAAPDGLWGNPLWQLQLDQVLGLGANASTAWGGALRVRNCSAPARSPATGAAAPYTAVIAALLPNGARIEAIVSGGGGQ